MMKTIAGWGSTGENSNVVMVGRSVHILKKTDFIREF
jgi:hypothetical protein